MFKVIISLLVFSTLVACGGSGGGSSTLITYDCPFEANDIEGCWVSTKCATSESGQVSSRIVLEVGEEELQRNIALYFNKSCTGQPDEVNEFSGPLTYEYDSTVTSSADVETDLYQFIGYTLISIENETMCFSNGVYKVADSHDFTFFDKEEYSLEVDFVNCVKRI